MSSERWHSVSIYLVLGLVYLAPQLVYSHSTRVGSLLGLGPQFTHLKKKPVEDVVPGCSAGM
jgi:hypothetical protein